MIIEYLATHGGKLLLGTTVILGCAAIVVSLARQPIWKQRVVEVSIAMTFVWLLLAMVPMQRSVLPMRWAVLPMRWAVLPMRGAVLPMITDWYWSNGASTNESKPTEIQLAELTPAIESELTAPIVSNAGESDHAAMPSGEPSRHLNQASVEESSPVWAPICSWVFLSCSACIGIGLLFARLMLARSRRRCSQPDAWLQELYAGLEKKRPAELLVSKENLRPMSFGLLRPVILLPASVCQQSDLGLIRHILRHEQTHVDRRDGIGHAILNCSLPLLWFHPLYWYLRSTATYARELIADDHAASQGDKMDYVSQLLGLIERSDFGRRNVASAIGVFGLRHPFTRRMAALVRRDVPLNNQIGLKRSIATTVLAILATCVLGTLVGVSPSKAQAPDLLDLAPAQASPQDQGTDQSAASDQVTPPGLSDENHLGSEKDAVRYHGIARAIRDVHAYAPEEGVVKEIHLRPGSAVKKGQPLIVLDNAELRQEFNLAKLQLENARVEMRNNRSAAGSVRQFDLKVTALKERLDRLAIVAPIDGIIDEVLVHVGEPVKRADKLCQIIALEQIRVDCDVPSDLFGPGELMERDAFVSVQVRERTLDLAGKVTFVSSKVDLNGRLRVWVDCDNAKENGQWLVKSGMSADVGFKPEDAGERAVPAGVKPNAKPNRKVAPDDREVVLLRELIELHGKTAKHAKLNLDGGTGTIQGLKAAETGLLLAKARLAIVLNDSDAVVSLYRKAIVAAEAAAEAQLAEYQGGRSSPYEVVRMNQLTTEIKLELNRFQDQLK